jgi:hypothetical protein
MSTLTVAADEASIQHIFRKRKKQHSAAGSVTIGTVCKQQLISNFFETKLSTLSGVAIWRPHAT